MIPRSPAASLALPVGGQCESPFLQANDPAGEHCRPLPIKAAVALHRIDNHDFCVQFLVAATTKEALTDHWTSGPHPVCMLNVSPLEASSLRSLSVAVSEVTSSGYVLSRGSVAEAVQLDSDMCRIYSEIKSATNPDTARLAHSPPAGDSETDAHIMTVAAMPSDSAVRGVIALRETSICDRLSRSAQTLGSEIAETHPPTSSIRRVVRLPVGQRRAPEFPMMVALGRSAPNLPGSIVVMHDAAEAEGAPAMPHLPVPAVVLGGAANVLRTAEDEALSEARYFSIDDVKCSQG